MFCEWTEWSPCSNICGKGLQSRRYELTMDDDRGTYCFIQDIRTERRLCETSCSSTPLFIGVLIFFVLCIIVVCAILLKKYKVCRCTDPPPPPDIEDSVSVDDQEFTKPPPEYSQLTTIINVPGPDADLDDSTSLPPSYDEAISMLGIGTKNVPLS